MSIQMFLTGKWMPKEPFENALNSKQIIIVEWKQKSLNLSYGKLNVLVSKLYMKRNGIFLYGFLSLV